MASPEQQQQLKELSDQYQNYQTEMQDVVTARQKLESQQQENLNVQKEFSSLDDEAEIYKLVGPVLLKQETAEAKSTVSGRLEFIAKEITRTETQVKTIQEQSEKTKMEIYQLQNTMQQAQTQSQTPVAA